MSHLLEVVLEIILKSTDETALSSNKNKEIVSFQNFLPIKSVILTHVF